MGEKKEYKNTSKQNITSSDSEGNLIYTVNKEGIIENSNDFINKFFVNKWIDVKDQSGKWYEAQIKGIKKDKIFVHYKAWGNVYDEWLSIYEHHRISPINTRTSQREMYPRIKIFLNEKCKVLDPYDKWYDATIKEINSEHDQILIHYTNWSDKYDEWIDINSYRIAPLDMERIKLKKTERYRKNEEDKLRSILKETYDWSITEMKNDGNCLFRAISHQIYGTEGNHQIVREKCVDYIELEKKFFCNFIVGGEKEIDNHCERMRKDGVWGDNLEIQSICKVYDRPIEIYDNNPVPMKIYHKPNNNPPIRLSYHCYTHYNSIIPQSQIIKEPPGVFEDRSLEKFKRRIKNSNNQNKLSDIEMTEYETIINTIKKSKIEFEDSHDKEVNKVVKSSKVSFESKCDKEFEKDTNEALKLSTKYSSEEMSEPIRNEIIRTIHKEFGFSLDKCVEAWTIFGSNENIEENKKNIMENMVTYIIENNKSRSNI